MRKEKTILLSEVRDALLKTETVGEAATFLNVPTKFLWETIETYPKVIPNVFTIEDDIVDDFTITNDLEDLVESAPKKKKKPTTTATTEEPDTATEPVVTATATTTVNVQTIAQTVEQELNELFPD